MVSSEQPTHQPPALPEVRVAVASEQGRREENQDFDSWTQTSRGELFVIADGMGGYKGGALAARMTVETVEREMEAAPPDWSFARAATEALSRANGEVHRLAHSGNPDTENMGSTALVVLLSDGLAHIAHVGDSRAYLLRDSKLQLLTRDHTRVQQMVDAEMLTPEQARHHPEGHLLSRAIGSRPEVEVEISDPLPLKKGDGLLLCSDGLSGFVSDDKIRAAVQKQRDVQRVPEDLVKLALDEGGNDNITIQFVRVDGTVRQRLTARLSAKQIREQGRPREAFVLRAKTTAPYFVIVAAAAVMAVKVVVPAMRPDPAAQPPRGTSAQPAPATSPRPTPQRSAGPAAPTQPVPPIPTAAPPPIAPTPPVPAAATRPTGTGTNESNGSVAPSRRGGTTTPPSTTKKGSASGNRRTRTPPDSDKTKKNESDAPGNSKPPAAGDTPASQSGSTPETPPASDPQPAPATPRAAPDPDTRPPAQEPPSPTTPNQTSEEPK